MKKLIKLGISVIAMATLCLSCMPQQHQSIAENKVVSYTFSDGVIYGEFEILDVEKNIVRGNLKLTNTKNSKISFPLRNVVFKNRASVGRIYFDYSKTIEEYKEQKQLERKNKTDLSKEEMSDLEKRHARHERSVERLMEMNKRVLLESDIELARSEEKSYLINIEFEKEIEDMKNVKIMLNGVYKQLLSKK